MQGSRKADIESIKSFISRQVDEYRAAYGRVVEKHPRTSIICGTTNSATGFLRDATGNRRFWPVIVKGDGRYSVFDMTAETRDQIWAEAVALYECCEDAYLDADTEEEARQAQREALEYDEREGKVVEYLDTLLPEDWYNWPVESRIKFFQDRDDPLTHQEEGTMRRTKVCSMELWGECFGRSERAMTKQDSWDMSALMARVPGWDRAWDRERIPGYGQQRPFVRS
jgi:hypothetical protein